MRASKRLYRPLLDRALRWRKATALIASLAVAGSLALFPFLGTEFVPRLEEGSVASLLSRQPSVSLDASLRISAEVERALMELPEVTKVVTKTGRPEVATDPMGPETSDVLVSLAPRKTWRFDSKEALVGAMRERLEAIPGIGASFSQPIALRVDELISGVKSEVATKIYGPDMDELSRLGDEVADVLRSVEGAADVKAEQTTGLGYLQVRTRRAAAARYGLTVGAIQRTIQTAIGGTAATEALEGDRRFAVVARCQEPYRNTPQAIRNIRLTRDAGWPSRPPRGRGRRADRAGTGPGQPRGEQAALHRGKQCHGPRHRGVRRGGAGRHRTRGGLPGGLLRGLGRPVREPAARARAA